MAAKHQTLARSAALLLWLSTLWLAPIAVPLWLWERHWLLRIPALLMVPLVVPITILLCVICAPFQAVGSFCAFMLHQQLGTKARLNYDGLTLSGLEWTVPFLVHWPELTVIRRYYAREFTDYQFRFRDTKAYSLQFKSGQQLEVDFVDEAALRLMAGEYGIALEGFDAAP